MEQLLQGHIVNSEGFAQGISVGRIVWYTTLADHHVVPAVITWIHAPVNGCVALQPFASPAMPTPTLMSSIYYDADGAPGTWRWPDRI